MTSKRYLYTVEYENDAERKRVEYLFNNWSDGTVERPDGLVRVAKDTPHKELYERLISKVPADRVSAYQLEPAETDVDPETVRVSQAIAAPTEAVESFVEYMLSKKKAGLQSAKHNEYEVYTKKGRATVSYTINETGDGVTVQITVVGHDPAPSFLAEFFTTELTNYADSQSNQP